MTPAAPWGPPSLTPKERRIMELLIAGKRYKAIGPLLGMGAHSVATRMETICNKLGADTGMQAVAKYLGHP